MLNPLLVAVSTSLYSMASGCTSTGCDSEMIIPVAMQSRNTSPTRSMNGSSGYNNFSATEKIAEPSAVPSAPLAVVRFQKMPRMNNAHTPGVKKPVNS